MNVQAILTDKGGDVISVLPSVSLEEVTKVLKQKRVGSVLVLDEDAALIGILSERDIVRAIATDGPGALAKPARDAMTQDVITCRREETIGSLMEKMTLGRFRHLPVVDGTTVVGVISIGDVVKQRIAEAEMEAQSMRAYIATG